MVALPVRPSGLDISSCLREAFSRSRSQIAQVPFLEDTGATTSDVTWIGGSLTANAAVGVAALNAVNRTASFGLSSNGQPFHFARTQSYSNPQSQVGGPGNPIILAESQTYDYASGIAVTTNGCGILQESVPPPFGHPGIVGAARATGHGASFTSQCPKVVTLAGTIYGFGGGTYPNAPKNVDFFCRGGNPAVLVPCNPSCSFSYTQRGGSITEWIFSSPVYSISETGPIYANVDLAIGAVGDVADGLKGRDVSYDAITIAHAGTLPIDSFNNTVPGTWTSASATITTTSFTKIAATGAGGSGTYTYSGVVPSLEAYRFANIVLNTQVGANVALMIKINGKTWNVTSGPTPGVDKTVQIDLCCPTSQDGTATGSIDTAYPRITNNGTSVTDSAHGGVTAVKTFTILGIPNGETVEVKSLTGIRTTRDSPRRDAPRNRSLLPLYQCRNCRLSALSRRGRTADQGLELLGNASPGTISQADTTIAGLVTALNARPGITAVDLIPSPPTTGPQSYYNNQAPGCFLLGAANAGGLGLNFASAITLQAISLFDSCDTYPGDSSGNTLNFVVWERGEMHGLTLDSSGKPVAGAFVSTSPNAGTATSDSLAYYQCGSPWALPATPGPNYTIVQSGETGIASLRKKTRALGAPSASGTNPWNWEHRAGWYAKVDVESGDAVFYGSDYPIPAPWRTTVRITNTGDVSDPRIAYDHRNVLYVVYAREIASVFSVYTRMSTDYGASWSAETPLGITKTNAHHPTINGALNGIVVSAAYVPNSGSTGPGTIWGQIQFPGDLAPAALVSGGVTPFQFVDNTHTPIAVIDDTFHIFLASDSPQRWLLVCTPPGGTGTVDYQSWDYCQTWTLIT